MQLQGAAHTQGLAVHKQWQHNETYTSHPIHHSRYPIAVCRLGCVNPLLHLHRVLWVQETPVDMCVERACIALLLGNTDRALQVLGLAADERQNAGNSPTQQAAQQYVLVSACGRLGLLVAAHAGLLVGMYERRSATTHTSCVSRRLLAAYPQPMCVAAGCGRRRQAHCADRDDLLPGVYALAQCWMQQGILGSFRQASGAVAADQQQQQQHPRGELDLAPWFDSLLVRLVILVRVDGSQGAGL